MFTSQPGGSTAGGTAFGNQPVVKVEDTFNNVETGDTTTHVTLGIGTNPGSGTVSCTTNPITVTNGVAAFAGCKIDDAGVGYTLTTTNDRSLTDATSTAFDVAVGSATKAVFAMQPGGSITGGTAFGTQPVVKIEDAGGNVVTSDNSTQVTLSISGGTGTAGAALSCTNNPVTAVNGVATFAGCTIDKAGTGYTLATTNTSSLADATSSSFNVAVGAAAKLAFTQQPSSSTGGIAFGTQPIVKVEDAGGNVIASDSSTQVTLSISGGTGTAGATLSCAANPVTAVNGVATFAGCTIDKAGTGYTLTASKSGLASGIGSTFDITTGPISTTVSTVAASPGAVAADGVAASTVTVTLLDAGGNPRQRQDRHPVCQPRHLDHLGGERPVERQRHRHLYRHRRHTGDGRLHGDRHDR